MNNLSAQAIVAATPDRPEVASAFVSTLSAIRPDIALAVARMEIQVERAVVRRLLRPLGHMDHVHQVGREAEAITELLDGERRADDRQARGVRERQHQEGHVGHVHGQHQRPQRALEAHAGDDPSRRPGRRA